MAILLQELTRPEAAARLAQMPVAILPVGSTEQHGPHLPLGTDIFLAEELAKRVSDATGAVVLPSLNFGYSWGWRDIPGTVTFSEKLMEEILIETARSVERYEVYARQMESPTWGGMFHAEEFETSLLLASDKKDLVQMDKAVREYPPVPPLYGMDDSSIGVISTSGVYGDATLASAEKGEAMMEEFARRTAALIGVALAGAQG